MIAAAICIVYVLAACVFMGVFRATFRGTEGATHCARCYSTTHRRAPVESIVWFWSGAAWPFVLLGLFGNWFGAQLSAAYEASKKPPEP